MKTIGIAALRSLPRNIIRFIRFDRIEDMDGEWRDVVVVMWHCRKTGVRVSDFCVRTGEYLGGSAREDRERDRLVTS